MRKRISIELPDVLAVDFECRKCHCHYSIPIGSVRNTPMTCPNCHETWFVGNRVFNEAPTDPTIPAFVGALREMKSLGGEAIIRLEIAAPREEESDSIKS